MRPLSSPMVVRSLDVKNDPFRPCEKDEELLGLEITYYSVIGALIILQIMHDHILHSR